MTLDDLARKYGKRLRLRARAGLHYVQELDKDGHFWAEWSEGQSPEEAVENAAAVFEHVGTPEAARTVLLEDVFVGVARELPSAALKAVLLERGDWSIDV